MIRSMVHTDDSQTVMMPPRILLVCLLLVAHLAMVAHTYAYEHAMEESECHQCMAAERLDDLVPSASITPPSRLTCPTAHQLRVDSLAAADSPIASSRSPPAHT
jgi:hypothetical protein